MSLSGRHERIESKSVGIAKIPVIESAQESKASDAVEAMREVRDTDDVDGFVEIQGSQSHIHNVNRERAVVRPSQTDCMHVDTTALQAIVLVQNQLERIPSSAGSRIGHQSPRDILTIGHPQLDRYYRTIAVQRVNLHGPAAQISWTWS